MVMQNISVRMPSVDLRTSSTRVSWDSMDFVQSKCSIAIWYFLTFQLSVSPVWNEVGCFYSTKQIRQPKLELNTAAKTPFSLRRIAPRDTYWTKRSTLSHVVQRPRKARWNNTSQMQIQYIKKYQKIWKNGFTQRFHSRGESVFLIFLL